MHLIRDPIRVWFVSGFVSGSCLVRVWFVSGSCLWFVSLVRSGSCFVRIGFDPGRVWFVVPGMVRVWARIWFVIGSYSTVFDLSLGFVVLSSLDRI